jgi:hypothetical protein
MNRSITRMGWIAVAGAAASGWLMAACLTHKRRHRMGREHQEIKEQIKTWEDEGGSLAPGAGARPRARTG